MALYYYDKYNPLYSYSEGPREDTTFSGSEPKANNGKIFKSYSFDKATGMYGTTGESVLTKDAIGLPGPFYDVTSNEPGVLKSFISVENDTNDRVFYRFWKYLPSKSIKKLEGRGTLGETNIAAENGTYPTNGLHVDGFWYVRKGLVNQAPTITLATTDNRTLYENDTFGISGSATDANNGDVVSVKYQINGGTVRAIATQISSGSAIPFNRSLMFRGGMLYDGATAVTPALAEGSQHVLKVWSEDDHGGKSAEQTRTFYVVPNRPASLTIDPFPSATDLIDTDKITINGNVSDPDNNDVTVKYKIANGSFTEVYSGSGGSFSFQLSLSALEIGANTITVQAEDSYGAVTSKTLQVTKAENNQPLKTAVTRYKLTPPNGTAKGVLLWVEREVGDLVVDAEISMTMSGEAEDFQPMNKSSTAFVTDGIEEDEFTFEADSAKENIVLKLTMTRSSTASDKGITLISGVLS